MSRLVDMALSDGMIWSVDFDKRSMLIEDALTIDWATPAVRKAFACGRSNGGTMSWHSADIELARIGFTWNATSKFIELRYAVDGVPVRQRVRVVQTTPRFGGVRHWFWCAVSNRRTRILVLAPDARRWVARAALRLPYRSQGERPAALRRVLAELRHERARARRNAVRRLRRRERAAEQRA
jgi:hypothetical protein